MSVLHLLSADGFIAVNRRIAEEVGLEAAVMLGELASECLYWKEHGGITDGFFYSTVENMESRVFLSAYSQRQALDKLQGLGLVDVEKKGMPAKRYIRLNEERILAAVNNKLLKNLTTSDENFSQQVVKNFNRNNTITNNKKEKEKSNNITIREQAIYNRILEQVPLITGDELLLQAFNDFISMRKQIKAPLTERALKMVINETVKLGNGNTDLMRAILNQSILNCWKGVYALKNAPAAPATPKTDNNPFTDMLRREGYIDGE